LIKPVDQHSDYLHFTCDKCGDTFHHAIRIYHDGPSRTEAAKYDVRNWIIAGIELQCPNCGDEAAFKLSIREDLAKPKR
jgi:predicted RNA-binding Zn-ribbon protein involved in translation (DUF1610 family)